MSAVPECLTRDDLCRVLKISPKTSRRMDRDGTGPRGVRLSPRIVRYPVAEVVGFMRAHGLAVPAEVEARR